MILKADAASTAVAIATDSLAVTKVLANFAKTHLNSIVGGQMDAGLLDAQAIEQLSNFHHCLKFVARLRILISI